MAEALLRKSTTMMLQLLGRACPFSPILGVVIVLLAVFLPTASSFVCSPATTPLSPSLATPSRSSPLSSPKAAVAADHRIPALRSSASGPSNGEDAEKFEDQHADRRGVTGRYSSFAEGIDPNDLDDKEFRSVLPTSSTARCAWGARDKEILLGGLEVPRPVLGVRLAGFLFNELAKFRHICFVLTGAEQQRETEGEDGRETAEQPGKQGPSRLHGNASRKETASGGLTHT